VVVVGGTAGIGREIAERAVARGDEVTITGRDKDRTAAVAAEIGDGVRSLALDLADPTGIAGGLG
jgi:short-subunit dehydrogenase